MQFTNSVYLYVYTNIGQIVQFFIKQLVHFFTKRMIFHFGNVNLMEMECGYILFPLHKKISHKTSGIPWIFKENMR